MAALVGVFIDLLLFLRFFPLFLFVLLRFIYAAAGKHSHHSNGEPSFGSTLSSELI